MPRVKIKTIISNNCNEKIEYNTKGIKNNNKICYLEDNISVSIEYFDKITLIRKDDIKTLTFEFSKKENTKCLCKIDNNTYILNIYTNKIEIKDNYIEIDYIIEDNKINYKLYIE